MPLISPSTVIGIFLLAGLLLLAFDGDDATAQNIVIGAFAVVFLLIVFGGLLAPMPRL